MVTVLRFANFLGPGMSTPMSAYFELPVVPTVLGFDPRIQLVPRGRRAGGPAARDRAGPPGDVQRRRRRGHAAVAGDPPAAASRSCGCRHRWCPRSAASCRRARLVDFSPEQLRFLTYGRGVDTTRMRSELGFSPQFSTMASVRRLREAPARPAGVAGERREGRAGRRGRADLEGRHVGGGSRWLSRGSPRSSRSPAAPPSSARAGPAVRRPSRARPGTAAHLREPVDEATSEQLRHRRGRRAGRRRRRGRVGPQGRRAAGVPAPAAHRRLRGRRVRLRRRAVRQGAAGRAAAAVPAVVPGRGARHREHPGQRRRAGGRQPLRHHRARLADDPARRARRAPAAPARCACSAPTWCSRRRSSSEFARKTGSTLACNADAERLLERGRAGRGVPRGLQGHRQAVHRAVQAAAVRPRRLRVGGAAHAGADHAGARSSAPRRSTRSSATPARSPGCSGCRTSRSRRRSRWLGPLGRDPAAVQVDHRVRRADPHRRTTRPVRPTTRCWCST